MRVGIDIRKYYDYGIGTYIQNIIKEYHRISEPELMYFAPDEEMRILKKSLKGEFVSDNSGKYSLHELISISRKANSCRLDLFHAPHYTLPFNLKMPCVVTIHDIIHLRFKEHFSFMKRSYAYLLIKHACSASTAIIVDSEHGKKDLLDLFDVDHHKIHVIPLGVDSSYFTKILNDEKESFRRKYSITKPFILYTGSLKPHKNVPVLLRAFQQLLRNHEIQLVITGEKFDQYPELMRLVSENGLKKSVCELGRIDQHELKMAYQSASAVVLPSLYEGFGFSMLEAMASGTPAIGASAASIPEVIGDAGLLFDPLDEHELARHLNTVMTNSALRLELINKGKERAKQFTWSRCAERTIHVYQKVI